MHIIFNVILVHIARLTGLGGGKSATSSGRPAGGGSFANSYAINFDNTDDDAKAASDLTLGQTDDWTVLRFGLNRPTQVAH